MTQTPDPGARRRVQPLAAPPGRFDDVLEAARNRRRHRGVVGGSTLAVVAVAIGAGSLATGRRTPSPGDDAATATATGAPSETPLSDVPSTPPAAPKRMRTTSDLPLVTEYMWNDEETVQLMKAAEILTGDCMQAQGFVYQPQKSAYSQGAAEALPEPSEPYGVYDARSAGVLGYHRRNSALDEELAKLTVKPGERVGIGTDGKLRVEPDEAATTPYEEALYGVGQQRAGGCSDESWKQLHDPQSEGYDVELWGRVLMSAQAATEQDPRVVAVTQKWSACMKPAGFSYSSPAQPAKANWGSPQTGPTATEIATATADVACKDKTGLVGTWLDVLEQQQRRLMADRRYKPTLDAQKKAMDDAVARAREVLSRQK